MTPLEAAARMWVTSRHRDAKHLVRTLKWVERLDPDAAEATRLAALTHDMERAVPGPDMPVLDARKGFPDPTFNRAHAERSARVVGEWLREQDAPAELTREVEELIRAHEEGGWPEADLVQAGDSLSFLETNVDLFLSWVPERRFHVGLPEVRAKLDYTFDRIRHPVAREEARPLLVAAHRTVDEWARTHDAED